MSQALTQDETCQHSVRPRHRTRRYMTRRASSVSGRTRRANSVTLAVAINNYHHPSAADVQTRTAITGNLVFVMHVLNTLQNIAIDAEFVMHVLNTLQNIAIDAELCSLVFFLNHCFKTMDCVPISGVYRHLYPTLILAF